MILYEIVKFVFDHIYLCRNWSERSVIPDLTCCGNFDALVFGYMNGASLSTNSRSNGKMPLSSNFRTPVSDLSYHYENLLQITVTMSSKLNEC